MAFLFCVPFSGFQDLRTDLRTQFQHMFSSAPQAQADYLSCWFASPRRSPLNPASAEAAPHKAPRRLNLDLGRHVRRNISRVRLRAHGMGVERACWQTSGNGRCDLCGLQDLQDEKHALASH
eukprot:1142841-Pelagomonas_calceolata.AAC.14